MTRRSSGKDAVVRALLRQIDEAFDRRSWHGTNLRGSVRGLSARVASWRPAPGRHSIREIVVHAAYWKYVVRRRLTGEPRGGFPLRGSNWWSREGSDEAAWSAEVRLLVGEHEKMRAVVAALRAPELECPARGGGTTRGALVRGIAAHDLYHAGQIQLLKRLRRE